MLACVAVFCAQLLVGRWFEVLFALWPWLWGAPIVLGSGRALFDRGLDELGLKLIEARPLSSGAVLLRYEPGQVPGESA